MLQMMTSNNTFCRTETTVRICRLPSRGMHTCTLGIPLTIALSATIRSSRTSRHAHPHSLKCFKMLSALLALLKLNINSLLSQRSSHLWLQLMMEFVVFQKSERLACTQYAATLIVEELKLAHSVGYQITEKDGKNVLESSSGRLHTVSIDDDVGRACSCSFHQTFHMPCCHIFTSYSNSPKATWVWNSNGGETLAEAVSALGGWNRWCCWFLYLWSTCRTARSPCIFYSSGVNLTGTLTRNQKYRKIQTLCQKLALIASQHGMVEFKKSMQKSSPLSDAGSLTPRLWSLLSQTLERWASSYKQLLWWLIGNSFESWNLITILI